MPYQDKVKGRASILLQNYMSPLKMFDYLAAKMIVVASNLKVYKHILKNNFNCLLVKINDDNMWSEAIKSALQTNVKNKYLKINAYKTAKKYNASVIVRITGDCPLIDPNIVDEMVSIFLKKKLDHLHFYSENLYLLTVSYTHLTLPTNREV